MSVDVDICNSALIKLGSERINALTDDNKRARLCQEQYPKILKRVLRSHPWKFGITRSKLSPITHTPEFGSENYFEQPLDCIRIIGVMADYDTSKTTEYHYSVEGRRIVSELDVINLKYITSTVPEAYFDEDFKEALACALAHDLCYSLNQSDAQKQGLFQEYEFWISQARSHGAMEITVDSLEFDTWTGSRL
jgi:hypothetical protein